MELFLLFSILGDLVLLFDHDLGVHVLDKRAVLQQPRHLLLRRSDFHLQVLTVCVARVPLPPKLIDLWVVETWIR